MYSLRNVKEKKMVLHNMSIGQWVRFQYSNPRDNGGSRIGQITHIRDTWVDYLKGHRYIDEKRSNRYLVNVKEIFYNSDKGRLDNRYRSFYTNLAGEVHRVNWLWILFYKVRLCLRGIKCSS